MPDGPMERYDTLDKLVLLPHTVPLVLIGTPWLREPTLAEPTPFTALKAEPVFTSCRLPFPEFPIVIGMPPFKALAKRPLAPI